MATSEDYMDLGAALRDGETLIQRREREWLEALPAFEITHPMFNETLWRSDLFYGLPQSCLRWFLTDFAALMLGRAEGQRFKIAPERAVPPSWSRYFDESLSLLRSIRSSLSRPMWYSFFHGRIFKDAGWLGLSRGEALVLREAGDDFDGPPYDVAAVSGFPFRDNDHRRMYFVGKHCHDAICTAAGGWSDFKPIHMAPGRQNPRVYDAVAWVVWRYVIDPFPGVAVADNAPVEILDVAPKEKAAVRWWHHHRLRALAECWLVWGEKAPEVLNSGSFSVGSKGLLEAYRICGDRLGDLILDGDVKILDEDPWIEF